MKSDLKITDKLLVFLVPVASNGGVETHIINILNSCAPSEVVIITRFFKSHSNLAKYCKNNNIKVIHFSIIPAYLLFFIAVKLRIKYFKKRIIFYTTELSYSCVLLSWFLLSRSKIINPVGDPEDIRNLVKKFLHLYGKSHLIIESSKHYNEINLSNAIVLPHISNIERMEILEKSHSQKFRLAFLGWLQDNKRPIETLLIFENLSKIKSNVILTYYGTGPEEATLRALVEDKCLSDKIFFKRGWNNLDELKEIHKEIDLCLFFSKKEGLPLTLIECCAFGTAFIATDVGVIETLLEFSPKSKLVKFNAEEISKAISIVIEDYHLKPHFPQKIDEAKFNNLYSRKSLTTSYINMINGIH
ncbi:MAG: glycosyltransferase [Chitinophagaceae bacterium]